MIGKPKKKSDSSVKCGICHGAIVDRAQIYQAGLNLGVVCNKCYKGFSTNDLEMMANMFIAYGGYFGMLKNSKFSPVKTIENILKNGLKEKKTVSTEQINIKLMHKTLLHGISPEEYIQNLSVLMED